MEIKAAKEGMLMSDVLMGNVPALENGDDQMLAELERKYVHVIGFMHKKNDPLLAIAGESTLIGLLQSVMFGEMPEIEYKVELSEALDVVSSDAVFSRFEMHLGDKETVLKGPFAIKASRIIDINAEQSTCIIMFQLDRSGV